VKIIIHLPYTHSMDSVPRDLQLALKTGNDGYEFDYDEVHAYYLTFVGIHPAMDLNKIQSIKEVRAFFKCGLMEAKDAVEKRPDRNGRKCEPPSCLRLDLTKEQVLDEIMDAARKGIILSADKTTGFEGPPAAPAAPRHLGDMLDSYGGIKRPCHEQEDIERNAAYGKYGREND